MAGGRRNPGDYVQYPFTIGDALYEAQNPSILNPFVTTSAMTAAIAAAVGANNELSEILANGNTTGGNNIAVSTGDKISGVVELTLDAATTIGITAGTGFTVTSTLGDVDFVSTAAAVNVTAATTVGITGGTGITATATTGDIALVSTAGDVNITAGDAVSATSVSITLNTRETIWTTQAADAIVLVDAFKLYSADIIAGNAAPHFKTEAGDIVKLFTGAALTAADAGVVNTGDATTDGVIDNMRIRIGELEARLQAHGLLA